MCNTARLPANVTHVNATGSAGMTRIEAAATRAIAQKSGDLPEYAADGRIGSVASGPIQTTPSSNAFERAAR